MKLRRNAIMKLRRNARYFVIEGNDRFHRLIPLVYRYKGLDPSTGKHMFEIVGNPGDGLLLPWIVGLDAVTPFSKARQREIGMIADYYNETNRVPNDKTIRRLLAGS